MSENCNNFHYPYSKTKKKCTLLFFFQGGTLNDFIELEYQMTLHTHNVISTVMASFKNLGNFSYQEETTPYCEEPNQVHTSLTSVTQQHQAIPDYSLDPRENNC